MKNIKLIIAIKPKFWDRTLKLLDSHIYNKTAMINFNMNGNFSFCLIKHSNIAVNKSHILVNSYLISTFCKVGRLLNINIAKPKIEVIDCCKR